MKNDFRWFVLNTWRDSKCGFDTGISNFPAELLEQQPQNHEFIDSTSNALKFQMRKVAHATAKDTDFPNHLNSTDYFLGKFCSHSYKSIIFVSVAKLIPQFKQFHLVSSLFWTTQTTFFLFHFERVCSEKIFAIATGKGKLKCGMKSITQVNYNPSNIRMV